MARTNSTILVRAETASTGLLVPDFGGDRMANDGEVYYCGSCKRQQQPSEGERCKICRKVTVSWDTRRESAADAQRKWEYVNGKP
jgi:hypothetical protein